MVRAIYYRLSRVIILSAANIKLLQQREANDVNNYQHREIILRGISRVLPVSILPTSTLEIPQVQSPHFLNF